MVNHTIHTCEQRVRFPLSAIVLFIHYITTLFYTHTQTYPYLFTSHKKPHHYIYIYKCVDITLLQNYIFTSYHTHHYLSYQDIYYLTYYSSPILLIQIYYTNLQSTLSKIDISYIHNYYSLTYTEIQKPTYLFTYFILPLYLYTYPYFIYYIYKLYFIYILTSTTSSLLLHQYSEHTYVYVHTYNILSIYIYTHVYYVQYCISVYLYISI